MNEFKINDFLTLKLEDGKTNIYLNGELFEQCKFLMLNIPLEEIENFDEIDSIDEAADLLGWTEEGQQGIEYEIDPETEFWGHCSNLQAWYENDYDTRILHSNLAFPLLKKLSKVGDPLAKKVFTKEIVERFKSGYPTAIIYIIEANFLDFLNIEDFLFLLKNIETIPDDYQQKMFNRLLEAAQTKGWIKKVCQVTKILEENNTTAFKFLLSLGFMEIFSDQDLYNLIKNPKILLKQNLLKLIGSGFDPDSRSTFFRNMMKATNSLICRIKNISSEWYQDFINLLLTELPKYPPFEYLHPDTYPLENYKFDLLEGFIPIGNITIYRDLATLEEIDALDKTILFEYNYEGKTYCVIKGIRPYELKEFYAISLEGVTPVVPSNLELLKDLEFLDLRYCGISTIKDLPKFKKLKYLHLESNELQDLEGIEKYPNLLELSVRKNKIVNIRAVRHLTKLTTLDLSYNLLEDFKLNPKNFKALLKLKKLSRLNIANNKSLNYEEIKEKLDINVIVKSPRRAPPDPFGDPNPLGFTFHR